MAQDLTQGKIGRTLLVFAAPIVAGMLLQTAFGIVDAFYIGMLGPQELAAISLAFPIFFVFIAISTGLEVGANALISRAVGAKDFRKAGIFAEHAIALSLMSGFAVGALGIVFAPTVFAFMGADGQLLQMSMQYALPIFAGAVFTFLWSASDAILRSQGDSRTPMKNLAIAVILNIILDPFLIFGIGPFPRWGLFGAAIVTVFADFIAAALNFRSLYAKKTIIPISLRKFRLHTGYLKQIITIGMPASVSNLISAGGFVLLTAVVGTFGSFAIAAYGIGMRVNSLAILPALGVELAVASFVGQNFGTKNAERARGAGLAGMRISFAASAAVAAVMMLFPEQIIRIFTSDTTVIEIGKGYLSTVPVAFAIYGIYFAMQGAFEGTGKTGLVLVTNIAYWVVAVALAGMLSQSMGLQGVWIGIIAAAAIELIAVAAIFRSGIWLGREKTLAGKINS